MSHLVKYSFIIDIDDIGISIPYEITSTHHIFLRFSDRKEIANINHRAITSRESHSYSTVRVVSNQIFLTISIGISESKIINIESTHINWLSECLIKTRNTIYLIIGEIYNGVSEINSEIISMIANRLRPLLSRRKLKHRCIIVDPS